MFISRYYRKSICLLQTCFKLLELDDHIQTVVLDIRKHWMDIEYELSIEIGSPVHRLLIDS